ncbi:hypothetical protein FJV00_10805 [Acinetobacter baumannii]|uniref:hypothetical protein n=1 Tax=Acinetobacter baumannii TaxID=470 RepID=UPI0011298522|nr:hypothetical protein [Acinetobacter baumannii]TPU09457.1 hypothetical protein FJV00_10805 [Acinetobacter baumannii]
MLFDDDEIKKFKYISEIAEYLNSIYISLVSRGVSTIYFINRETLIDNLFKKLKNCLIDVDNFGSMLSNENSKVFLENIIKKLNLSINSDYMSYSKGIHIVEVYINLLINRFEEFFAEIVDNPAFSDGPATLNLTPKTIEYAQYLKSIKNIQPTVDIGNNSITRKIIILEDKVNKILSKNDIESELFNSKLNDFFDVNKNKYEQRVDKIISDFKSNIDNIQIPYEKDLKGKVSELKRNFESNKVELDGLLGDVKLYQDKMTNKAVSEMSAHYYEKSKFERNSYFAVTIASAIIIICSVISAYNGVNNYYDEYVSTKSCDSSESRTVKVNGAIKEMSFEECMSDLTVKRDTTQKYAFNYLIFRLSFSLLLFLAVIYASRIAMRAYNHWRQSENMYLKLNTLSPFIGSLDKSVRNDVHLSLVPDYFGKDAGIVEGSKDAVKDIPTNISNIAIKAIEQAGSTIGSKLGNDKEIKNSDSESSTEKNKKKSEDESQ